MRLSTMDKIYLDPQHPGSFGGVARLKKEVDNTTAEVKKFLSSQYCYTRHKQRRNKFVRRKVEVHESFYLWQADLVFLKKIKKYNDNFAYLLTVIDCFSRYAYVVPIKNKTSAAVIEGFIKIFKLSTQRPKYLQCDQGSEFFSRECQKFLRNNDVQLCHNYSDFKACVVERFNRTLLDRLSKLISHTQNYRYIEVLQHVVQSYNASIHSAIGISPKDVTNENAMDAWLYDHRKIIYQKKKKSTLNLHDSVRLLKKSKTFEKGYMPTHTSEIYQIAEIIDTNPICYRIRDSKNQKVMGIFYQQELQKIQ